MEKRRRFTSRLGMRDVVTVAVMNARHSVAHIGGHVQQVGPANETYSVRKEGTILQTSGDSKVAEDGSMGEEEQRERGLEKRYTEDNTFMVENPAWCTTFRRSATHKAHSQRA